MVKKHKYLRIYILSFWIVAYVVSLVFSYIQSKPTHTWLKKNNTDNYGISSDIEFLENYNGGEINLHFNLLSSGNYQNDNLRKYICYVDNNNTLQPAKYNNRDNDNNDNNRDSDSNNDDGTFRITSKHRKGILPYPYISREYQIGFMLVDMTHDNNLKPLSPDCSIQLIKNESSSVIPKYNSNAKIPTLDNINKDPQCKALDFDKIYEIQLGVPLTFKTIYGAVVILIILSFISLIQGNHNLPEITSTIFAISAGSISLYSGKVDSFFKCAFILSVFTIAICQVSSLIIIRFYSKNDPGENNE